MYLYCTWLNIYRFTELSISKISNMYETTPKQHFWSMSVFSNITCKLRYVLHRLSLWTCDPICMIYSMSLHVRAWCLFRVWRTEHETAACHSFGQSGGCVTNELLLLSMKTLYLMTFIFALMVTHLLWQYSCDHEDKGRVYRWIKSIIRQRQMWFL